MTPLLVGMLTASALLSAMGRPAVSPRPSAVAGGRTARRRAPAAAVAFAAAAAAGSVVADSLSATIDLLGVAAVAAVVGWLVRRHRAEAERRRRQDAVIGLCGALAAELHAGLPTQTALLRACSEYPEFSSIAQTARVGGEIAAELRSLARRPGAAGLRAIAAGWTVAAQSGGSLARVLDCLLDGLRDEAAAVSEVDAALEAPRVTARMLAVLPLFGVALGAAMGAGPVGFLIETVAGRLCLLAGVLLSLAGVCWIERLALTATR
jgi:tight adherence protein B